MGRAREALETPAAAIRLVRDRNLFLPRRDPAVPFRSYRLPTPDGVILSVRGIVRGREAAVILAHPAVTGQRYAPLVELAEKLSDDFDVYTFDFRGHGESGGRMRLGLEGAVVDLAAVAGMVRSAGYRWVGAVGFSLGGMSGLVLAARENPFQALVVVGMPPRFPALTPWRRLFLPPWLLVLRLLGARFSLAAGEVEHPVDAAEAFPGIPLLVVHGEREAFYSRRELDELLQRLGGSAELWIVEGAGHAELRGGEGEVVEWLRKRREEGADESAPEG